MIFSMGKRAAQNTNISLKVKKKQKKQNANNSGKQIALCCHQVVKLNLLSIEGAARGHKCFHC